MDDLRYSYYSKVLKEPFDSIEELKKAEEVYYAKLKAQEDKAAAKNADIEAVETAFKELNAARKTYRQNVLDLTTEYKEDLEELKADFERDKEQLDLLLSNSEENYTKALKAFIKKYPEGFNLLLKDGDIETTISRTAGSKTNINESLLERINDCFRIFNWI